METFKKNLKHQSGFTLIEILIAIAILSFMMVSVFQITSESIDTKEMVTREDREFLQVDRALSRLELDFTEIYTPLYYSHRFRSENQPNRFDRRNNDGQGRPSPMAQPPRYQTSEKYRQVTHHGRPVPYFESPDSNTFIFKAASNRRKFADSKESNYAWIRYSLEAMLNDPAPHRSDGGQRLIRQVQASDIYSPEHYWGDFEEQTILNNVRSFTVEYWNPSTQNWVGTLDQLNENRNRLAMIRVFLEWVNSDGITQEFSRTYRHHWTRYDPALDEAAYREANRPQGMGGDPNDPDNEFRDEGF